MDSDAVADVGVESLQDETVLITGGAGFIGHHLAHALVDHCEVRILDDFSSGTREWVPEKAEVIEGDVRDSDVVLDVAGGVDVIFHLAAVVSVAESVARPKETHEVNVDGTVSVLEAARESDAKVVFASSASVYGDPEDIPIAETHPLDPKSPYGLQKRVSEEYLEFYAEFFDVETVALRLFNVYGPGQPNGEYSGVIGNFLTRAAADEALEIHGDGTQTRDFVHVDDVVRAFVAAAGENLSGGVINVGTGGETSIRGLAEVVLEVTGADSELVYTEKRPGDIDRSKADIGRAKERLGFEPRVGLAEGIESVASSR